jgi:3-phenylpropionate/trans-cinnamate dioxygenase ferredoxin reductase subunit
MATTNALLIVGGGLAGAKAAEAARGAGFDGRIALVADEPTLPYERPPLSKAVLRGEADPTSTQVHDRQFYADSGIELICGDAVDSVDAAAGRAHLASGSRIDFGTLILATGTAPRRLGVPGHGLDGVHYLRTIEDSLRLHERLEQGGRLAVIGAGWIGSEVTASARQLGVDVVLVDPLPTPLQRVLGSEVGGMFAGLHGDHGVDLRLGVGVTALQGSGTVERVVLSDGTVEPVDAVAVGIGVLPLVELAQRAGLRVDNGVLVDEYLRTSAPNVYAAGDVANAWHPHYGRRLRVEHWANALHQGAAAGRNAVGAPEPFTRLPYFFSDQYDLGMEYVGHAGPDDDVVIRGSLEKRECIAFYHRGGRVTAALAVNVWEVIEDLKRLLATEAPVSLDRLADPDVPLDAFTGPGRSPADPHTPRIFSRDSQILPR